MSLRLRKVSKFRLLIIFFASVSLILSIINFFSKTDLTPLILTLVSSCFTLNGVKLVLNQSRKLGAFYLSVGSLYLLYQLL
jgi:hypothetical protein